MNITNYCVWKKIEDLQPNDTILHPLYREDGLLLIQRFKRITTSIIKHLNRHFSENFPVLVASTDEKFHEFIDNKLYLDPQFKQEIHKLNDIHKNTFAYSVTNTYAEYNNADHSIDMHSDSKPEQVSSSNILYSFPLWHSFDDLLESKSLKIRAKMIKRRIEKSLAQNPELLDLIGMLKGYHDVSYIHSMNTLIISLLIGLSLELDYDDLEDLALATLFTDIGFTAIDPKEYKNYLDNAKNDKQTLEHHINQSIEIVRKVERLNRKSIINAILDHHEYYNGQGLPNRKTSQEISLFGRIIAIAHAYDEMVGGYIQERTVCSLEAQLKIWQERGQKFDQDILRIYFSKIGLFKVNQPVILNNTQSGIIIGFTDYLNEPLLPKIKLSTGEIKDYYFIKDLSELKITNK